MSSVGLWLTLEMENGWPWRRCQMSSRTSFLQNASTGSWGCFVISNMKMWVDLILIYLADKTLICHCSFICSCEYKWEKDFFFFLFGRRISSLLTSWHCLQSVNQFKYLCRITMCTFFSVEYKNSWAFKMHKPELYFSLFYFNWGPKWFFLY